MSRPPVKAGGAFGSANRRKITEYLWSFSLDRDRVFPAKESCRSGYTYKFPSETEKKNPPMKSVEMTQVIADTSKHTGINILPPPHK